MTNTSVDTDEPPQIAITGAAGYIGSRVVKLLTDKHPDWEYVALDNFYLGDVREINDIHVQHVDVRNRSALEDALAGSDVVLHLAAVSGVDDCQQNQDLAYDVNVTGTNNVAWFCRKTGAGLVFPFSMAVLGDPQDFPITVDDPRDPFNWYGRAKLLGERAIESFAEDAFPAHLFLKSNLYGEHELNGRRVSKGTVINFFVSRAISGEPLTVYEPGSQSRNYVHVDDVARAYVHSTERLLDQVADGQTGVEKYEIASGEDPSVQAVAETVQRLAAEERDQDVEVKLVENPRGDDETLVQDFAVDTSKAQSVLGWEPRHTVEASIRGLLRDAASTSD
ncbi:NAD-dependent epimerase/dehydratase family protein [Halobacterium bonnevillei]|uniref:NAD-dependent epimerase/dehydratase family protein n=1 Tax=Halobacterium bonnevillei TaxID=2692200 RepID=A0A6B0SBF6_9EURY|nr:NAD(P)-dependent oxidoreductase [Halobacterium bonnevillei]MXR19095.1 NAD-dependent epimerase/dehydratase family protein [Halobacterium bonnevillei]